jgi:hypothetical protein
MPATILAQPESARDILSPMYKPLVTITTLVLFSAVAGAQDDAQYKAWMMSLQPALRAIRGAADNAAAAADATKLADTFDKVAAFWKARSADDAVKLAETARDAAKAIASGSGDKAANLMTIQGTCGPCHTAHREGAAPNFKIK